MYAFMYVMYACMLHVCIYVYMCMYVRMYVCMYVSITFLNHAAQFFYMSQSMNFKHFLPAVTIGFEQPVHSATEGSDASVEVCASVHDGTLQRTVTVTFFTTDGTATSVG